MGRECREDTAEITDIPEPTSKPKAYDTEPSTIEVMKMFLTKEEVAELSGYRKPSAQINWLQAEQFGFAVGGDGHPKVLRAVVINRLGGQTEQRKKPELRLK